MASWEGVGAEVSCDRDGCANGAEGGWGRGRGRGGEGERERKENEEVRNHPEAIEEENKKNQEKLEKIVLKIFPSGSKIDISCLLVHLIKV